MIFIISEKAYANAISY